MLINIESCVALAGLVLLLLRARHAGGERDDTATRGPGWRVVAFVVVAAILAFWRSAGFYFLSDDFVLLKHAAAIRAHPWTPFSSIGGDGFFRPVGYVLLALNSTWAGVSPVAWHWTGFGIHAINSAMVAVLGSYLGLSRLGCLFAGLLFGLHATRPESVLWVAGRFDLLAAFFGLVALICFLRSWHYAALAAMILAILCKESAYAVPLMIVFITRTAPSREHGRYLPYVIVAAGVFVWRWILLGGIGGYADAGTPAILAFLKVLVLRVWAILFFPINWAVAPGAWLVAAMAVYLVGLVLMLCVRAEFKRLVIPVGFVLLAALPPVQQLLISTDLQKSRLLYLPSVGFCLLLATASEYLKPNMRWAATAAMIGFQVVALQHNLGVWEYVSNRVKQTCALAASCQPATVRGLPGSLHGVYFLANGFEQCVALQRTAPATPCRLEWDGTTDSVRE